MGIFGYVKKCKVCDQRGKFTIIEPITDNIIKYVDCEICNGTGWVKIDPKLEQDFLDEDNWRNKS